MHHENLCILDRIRTEETRIELVILWLNKRNNGVEAKLIKYIQLAKEETQSKEDIRLAKARVL